MIGRLQGPLALTTTPHNYTYIQEKIVMIKKKIQWLFKLLYTAGRKIKRTNQKLIFFFLFIKQEFNRRNKIVSALTEKKIHRGECLRV